jgi:hypothetical protein
MTSMPQRKIVLALYAAALVASPAAAQVFGTAGEVPFALHGRVYYIPENTETLPDFSRLRPVGTISATRLDIQPQSFTAGFPGVTDRFEWFAIDYKGRISLVEAGTYTFRLTSDDGAKLFIDGREVIDNDGIHGPGSIDAEVELAAGIHEIRVPYFQGPREEIALVLEWGPDAENLRPLDFAALAPARFRREGNRLRAEMSGGVLFDTNSAELRPQALVLLAELKRTMVDPNPRRPHQHRGPHGRRGRRRRQPVALGAPGALRIGVAHGPGRRRGADGGLRGRRVAPQGAQHLRRQPRPEPPHRDYRHASLSRRKGRGQVTGDRGQPATTSRPSRRRASFVAVASDRRDLRISPACARRRGA